MLIHAAEDSEELKNEVQPAVNEVKGSKGKDLECRKREEGRGSDQGNAGGCGRGNFED